MPAYKDSLSRAKLVNVLYQSESELHTRLRIIFRKKPSSSQ